MYEKLQSEFERFKQQYEAAGDKIKSLEMELDLQASLHNSPNSKVFKQIGDIEVKRVICKGNYSSSIILFNRREEVI